MATCLFGPVGGLQWISSGNGGHRGVQGLVCRNCMEWGGWRLRRCMTRGISESLVRLDDELCLDCYFRTWQLLLLSLRTEGGR